MSEESEESLNLSESTTPDGGSHADRTALSNIIQLKKVECEEKLLLENDDSSANEGFCPGTWDGVLCWEKTKSGLSSLPCPEYIVGFNHQENASKLCNEDGSWYHHPDTNSSWTNYSLCVPVPVPPIETHKIIADWLPIIKLISQVGYSVSLVTLFISFCILISIKAGGTLLKDGLFIDGIGLPQTILDSRFLHENPNWECKLVTTLWQYFIVANYTWILMEGFYLHNLIFLAPFSDSSGITLYVILGWGCPIPVVGAWVAARIFLDDSLCWTTHHNHANLFLIVRIPIIITIVLNFIFFVNIARVLLIKLQSAVSIESRKYRYRKWSRSTLILIWLFGIHYMVFLGLSYYMGVNPVIEVIWLFCDQLFASFQGFFVAILYCLLNGEVRSELGKKWNTWKTDSESKNIWIPLNHITSKFYRHRSTNDELSNGFSGGTSVAAVPHNAAMRGPFVDICSSRGRTIEQELTEEHPIHIESNVGLMKL